MFMKIQIVFFYIHQSHVLVFILQYIQCILLDLRIQHLKTQASLMSGIAINIEVHFCSAKASDNI